MSALRARLAALWRREPVLVGTALPVLVTLGILTQDQASAVTNVIAGVVALAAQFGVAVKVRSVVTAPPKAKS